MKLKNSHSKFLLSFSAILAAITFSLSTYAESLSYSGRLVNANGSPVTGTPTLLFELAYSGSTGAILCTDSVDVNLTNGVFHVALDFDCTIAGKTFEQVMAEIPSGQTAAIRVTNGTKVYSFQAIHSVPSALVAQNLSKLNANNNEVLTWTGSKWEPKPIVGATGGTVTDITAGSGLSGGTITNSGTIAIDVAGVTDTHLAGNISRSKLANGTANYVLVNNASGVMSEVAQLPLAQGGTGASTAAAARTNLGIGTIATLSYGAGWDQLIAANLPTCFGTEKLTITAPPTVTFACVPDISTDNTKLPLAGGTMTGDIDMGGKTIINIANPVNPGDAANMAYVDAQIGGASVWTKSGTIVYYNSGNVGIGTTTPDQKLHLTSSGSSAQLALERTGAAAGKAYIGADDNGFNILDSGYVKRLTVSPTGNVGIGTITPAEKLDVVGNAAISGKLRLKSDNTNFVEVKAPSSLAATFILNLPGDDGNSGQALITDGSGNLSWATVATGATAVGGDLTGTVTNAQIAVGAIADADISASAAIAQSKISGLTTDLGNKEPKITAGTASQYWKGDKSWGSLQTDVQALVMNGFAVGSNAAVTNADTLSGALGKVQGQINAANTSVAALASSQANYVLKAGDTMSGALAMGNNKITGLGAPTVGTDATTKTYVDTQIASSASKWTLNSNNISNNNTGHVSIGTTDPFLGKTSNSYTKYLALTGTAAASNQSFGALRLGGNQPTAAAGDRIGAIQFTSLNNPDALANFGDAAIFGMLEGSGGASGFGTSLSFWTRADNTTSVTQKMTISQNGNVGIGTGVPTHLLHMNTVSGHAGIGLNAPAANYSYIDFYRAGAKKANIFYNGTTDKFLINDVGSVDTVINGNGGNVGVGVVPTEKFEVGGNIAVNGKVRMKSDNTNYVELKAPNGLAATTTYTFPATAGTSGYVLTTDGVGALSWTQAATSATNVGGDLTGTIANAQIAPGSVTTTEILDGTIANADIANGTIAYAKLNLADGDVPLAKLSGTSDSTKYLRGDKTWQTLNTTAVPEGTNQYFTQARVRATPINSYVVGTAIPLAPTDTVLEALGKLEAQIIANDAAFDNSGVWSKNGTDVYYNGGNVGVGTSTPLVKFHVAGTSANDVASYVINSDDTGTASRSILLLGTATAGTRYGYFSHQGAGYTASSFMKPRTTVLSGLDTGGLNVVGNSQIGFWIGTSEKMKLASDGNLGVGTSAPTNALHVERAVNNEYAARISNAGGDGQGLLIHSSDGDPADVQPALSIRSYNQSKSMLEVLSNGLIGVGLSNPAGQLSNWNTNILDPNAIGGAANSSLLWSANSIGYTALFENRDATATSRNGLLVKTAATDTNSSIARFVSGGTDKLIVKANGNVGVGTGSPTTKFEVAGDAKVTGNLYGAVKDTSGTPMRSCVGTSPNSGWVYYNLDAVSTGFCTAYLDINTSACGFSSIFNYFPTLHGDGTHYGTMGATSIYSMTTTSFRLYVTIGGAYNATNCSASGVPHNTLRYYIKWMGVGQ
ncbi:beta strand repeat-containing protein [Peredibacter sp. HCB2-198]|uniref:beta strand repeat-containing protein n=1 Tax=Peredibacter sp. HCB2-198 TaxID=3383025 RepID=UPI0038B6AB86